jgi:sugar phosphate isomerase/epimerase
MSRIDKFSTVLNTFSALGDRFCLSGYKEKRSIEEMFLDASKVEGLSGLELVGTWHIDQNNISFIKSLKNKYGFKIPSIVIDIFTKPEYGNGSFSSNNKKVREKAIQEVNKFMDIAPELDCDLITIWLAQDGYDYIFQANYIKAWNSIKECLRECADHRSDIKLALEYKIKEPRTHCYVGTIGKSLNLLKEIDRNNLGLTIDVGHASFAYENPAESIALSKLFGNKLFHIHLNDNYGHWDDDMLVASVNVSNYIEIIYWLKRIEYDGWYSFDIYPYRENGIGSIQECIKWTNNVFNILEEFDESEIEEIINKGDALESAALMRKMIFRDSK